MARQKGNKNMRNKMLGILLPVLAGVAVIGTGFSTWYFTNGVDTKNKDIPVSLAAAAEIGELGFPEANPLPTTLHLDASVKGDSPNSGIHLGTIGENSVFTADDKIEWTYNYQASEETLDKHPELTIDVKINGIGNYVDIKVSDSDYIVQSQATDTYQYTWKKTDIIPASYTPSTKTEFTDDFTFAFSWKTNQEPKSFTAWQALSDAITDNAPVVLTIKLSLDWVDNV